MTPRTIQSITLAPGADYAGQWIDRPRLVHAVLFQGEGDVTNTSAAAIAVPGLTLAGLLGLTLNTSLSCGPIAVQVSGDDLLLLGLRRRHRVGDPEDQVTIGAGATVHATIAALVPLADYRLVLADGEPEGALWGRYLTDYRVSFASAVPGYPSLTLGNWSGSVVALEGDSDVAGSIAAPLVIRSWSATEAVQRVFGTRIVDVLVRGSLAGNEMIALRDAGGSIVDYSSIGAVSYARQSADDPDYRLPEQAAYCLATRTGSQRAWLLPRAPLEVQSFSGPWPSGTRIITASYGGIDADLAGWLRRHPDARMLGPDGAREASQVRSARAREMARIARFSIQ